MTMKIAIVYFGEFPRKIGGTGADRRVRDIARGLAAQDGVDVTMLVPRRSDDQEKLEMDGLNITYLGQVKRNGLWWYLSRLAFWKDVLKLNHRLPFDWILLYSPTIDALFPAWRLKSSGTKIATEMCDLRSVGFTKSSIRKFFNAQLFKLDENLIPKVTNLNIVISRFLEDHVRRVAPNTPVMRLPVLVDKALFVPVENAPLIAKNRFGVAEEDFAVVYAGGLWKQEGVRYLVEAFSEVVRRFPHSKLIIAGRIVPDSNDHDDIEKLVRKLQIREQVVLAGWVSTDDVILLYSRANVLVLPQINDKFAIAALPTKLAEYSAMRKPIIATRVGDVPMYFTDDESALLVESEDALQLQKALERIISNPELQEQLAAGAARVGDTHFDYRISGKHILRKMADC